MVVLITVVVGKGISVLALNPPAPAVNVSARAVPLSCILIINVCPCVGVPEGTANVYAPVAPSTI